MAENDEQGWQKPSRSRRPNESIADYGVWVGKEELSRAVQYEIAKMELISRKEAAELIGAAVKISNESSYKRWYNIGLSVSTDANTPGGQEHEMRSVLNYSREFFLAREEFRKLLDYLHYLFDNREENRKLLDHVKMQMEEEDANRGRGMRNAAVIATIVGALVGVIGTAIGLWSHMH